MNERPRQRSPWRLSFIIFLGVTGFYIFLARPAEPVNDLTVSGKLAYLALGRAGLVIVDVSEADNPDQIGSFDTRGAANGVAVDDLNAYIADGRDGLRVMDVSNPSKPKEIGAYNTTGYAQDLDVVKNSVYLADGGAGLLIIDVKDKSNPFLVSSFPIRGRIRRVAVQGKYAYLGDNQNQLRVVDISKPRQLEQVAVLDVGAIIQDMDISANKIYLALGNQGMKIVDISDPDQPEVETSIETPGRVQDVAVNKDIVAYLADGENGLLVYDISDLKAIEQVGSYDKFLNVNQIVLDEGGLYLSDKDSALYVVDAEVTLDAQRVSSTQQQQGNAQSVAISNNYAFLAYADQGLRVIDITNPETPSEVTTYESPGEANGVTFSGDFVYLADGSAGLRVLFLESPGTQNLELSEISEIDTPGEAYQTAVVGQTIYLADGSEGLSVISMANPAQPEIIGSINTPGRTSDVVVLGNYAYIADGAGGLRVINILDGTQPAEVGHFDTPGESNSVEVRQITEPEQKILAYVADGTGGLRIIDVTEPTSPFEIGVFTAYEMVLDVIVSGENAFLALGNLGFAIVRVADPADVEEVGMISTPGEARGLASEGQYIYVADGTRGMSVVDVSDPSVPVEVGFYDIPRFVRGVTIAGDYAYLADVEGGFRIAEISDPRQLKHVGHYDQGGIIEDIAIQDKVAYLADSFGLQAVNVEDERNPSWLGSMRTSGRANSVFVDNNLAYITDGASGLRIADISDPTDIQSLGSHPTLGSAQDVFVAGEYAYIADGEAGLVIINVADPRDPKTTSVIDPFQNANSVRVLGDYAYLADENNGVWVIDVSKPVTPETVAFVDTPGTALDLESSGVYLFVADGEAGVQVIYILNPSDPTLVGGVELDGFSLNLDAEWRSGSEGNPGSFFIYVAKGDQGLEIVSVGKGVEAGSIGLYETPGMAPLRQVVQDRFPIILSPGNEKSARTVRQTAFDVFVIGMLGLLFWLGFFAQYVLPLNTLPERSAAFSRLVRYVMRSHGPAIRVENGKVIQSLGEGRRSGPGVILLDTASAAMLRTKTTFVGAIGPGVVFTEKGQFLHKETIDLHTQVGPVVPLGPWEREDPFAPWNKRNEDDKAYQARQTRRKETSGLTRDGVEVVPRIFAVVKTISLPGAGGTRFGFNPESVRLAITREGIVPNGLRNVPWYEIPAYLAVDVWREYLAKFKLNELFAALDEGFLGAETGFELIQEMVNMRLTEAEVPNLNNYGRFIGGSIGSREFSILQEMGIQVQKVSISGLRFPRTIESQLVQQWLSTWLESAIEEREEIENLQIMARTSGENTAILDFANSAVGSIWDAFVDDDGNELPDGSPLLPNLQASLDMLVSGTQELIADNPGLSQWFVDGECDINALLAWIGGE